MQWMARVTAARDARTQMLRRSVLAGILALAACSSEGAVGREERGGGAGRGDDALDGGTSSPETPGGDPASSPGGVIDAGGVADIPCTDQCMEGLRCFNAVCIPDNGTCDAAMPCATNDTACVEGICVPYGDEPLGDKNAACVRGPAPLAAFIPEVQCEWPGMFMIDEPTKTEILAPPMIADLDGDEVPEIIFTSFDASLYMMNTGSGVVRAIRGDDCSPVWDYLGPVADAQSLVVADLDEDGSPEVCTRGDANSGGCRIFCLDSNGTPLWTAKSGGTELAHACDAKHVGMAAANVDETGPPELVVGLTVIDGKTGDVKHSGPNPNSSSPNVKWSTSIAAIADVDADGHAEALTGGVVYDLVDGKIDVDWSLNHGNTAVAELASAHPGPEVVTVEYWNARIRVNALDGTEIFSAAIPGGAGGPPTIADLDGDGRAEFSTAGMNCLTAFDLDCVGAAPDAKLCPARQVTPNATQCPTASDGIMWTVPTHERSSGFTGSVVFDFEGDGPVEIVYADECWARVFDGQTGTVKFSAQHIAGTAFETPVVGDVDGDFFTEIVVPHNDFEFIDCSDEPTDPLIVAGHPLHPSPARDASKKVTGLTVYRDQDDRWAPSRSVWGQHAYHVSERNDDSSIPVMETPSWTSHNSYRQQLPGSGGTAMDVPDLTAGPVGGPPCDEEAHVQKLEVPICNRGTLPVAAGVTLQLRLDDAEGDLLCALATTKTLAPGTCETLSCDWNDISLNDTRMVWAVVDGDNVVPECIEGNNRGAGEIRCPPKIVQ